MVSNGMIQLLSDFGPKDTVEHIAVAASKYGMMILARIDHAAAAAKVGMELRPTEVLIFGNPRVGTQLMQASQPVGLDLPLKVLVWQDEMGKTWIAYNDPGWLAARHGLPVETGRIVDDMSASLAAIMQETTPRSTVKAS
jgi:uncharacterized protein (DUF302 family)